MADTQKRRLAILAVVSLAALVVPGHMSTAQASGTTYYASTAGSDTNSCRAADNPCASIRVAIAKAGIGDTVSVAAGTYHEHLAIAQDVTLVGAGTNSTIIDGDNSSPAVLTVVPGVTVNVSGLTIQDGNTNGESIANNLTAGGIDNLGTLNATLVTVRNNGSGGVDNLGDMTLISSTVSGNAGYPFAGGIYNDGHQLTVQDSTISGNTGGALYNSFGLTIINSTISGNAGRPGNASALENAVPGTVGLYNTTIVSNTAALDSRGYGRAAVDTTSFIYVANTIIAGNTVTGYNSPGAYDCGGTFNSEGYNLIGSTGPGGQYFPSCAGFTASGDQVGTVASPLDPTVGPLHNNGGPTLTQALLAGSPAIDAGDPSGCAAGPSYSRSPLTTDGRGLPRPSGSRCDIGAYELQQSAPGPAATATPGNTATASGTPNPTATASGTPNPAATASGTPAPANTGTETSTPTPAATVTSTSTPVNTAVTASARTQAGNLSGGEEDVFLTNTATITDLTIHIYIGTAPNNGALANVRLYDTFGNLHRTVLPPSGRYLYTPYDAMFRLPAGQTVSPGTMRVAAAQFDFFNGSGNQHTYGNDHYTVNGMTSDGAPFSLSGNF